MPQFFIEREMPGVGNFCAADLKGASQNSCSVLRNLGPDIQWVHSYITDDKIYCIYRAPSDAHHRMPRAPPCTAAGTRRNSAASPA